MMDVLTLDEIRARLRNVVRDWCEYSGQSMEHVIRLIERGSELARKDWKRIVKSSADEEILKFYSESQYYIYEVLQPYLNPEAYN